MSYHFVDTHCRFGFPPFTGDESAGIQRAAEVGVQGIIVPATQAANFPRVLTLTENHPPLFAMLGLHPIVIEQHSDDCLGQLQQEPGRRLQKLVVLGETELDSYRDGPQFDKQKRVLGAQLKLVKRYELPVILHSRCTHDKLVIHLKRHTSSRTGVVHSFSGSVQQAERSVQLGYKAGVEGTVTHPRASRTREVIAQLPLESLLPEIDAPDMPLNGFQGQPNCLRQVVRVFGILYELRPEPVDVITDAPYRNTTTLFDM